MPARDQPARNHHPRPGGRRSEAHGLRISDDLAVVGFGNTRLSRETIPPITSVAIDGAKVGRELATLLEDRNTNRERARRSIDLGFELIGRASC